MDKELRGKLITIVVSSVVSFAALFAAAKLTDDVQAFSQEKIRYEQERNEKTAYIFESGYNTR
ncbi:MAG: hypothetical protein LBM16_03325 [Clostridiales bacterium]|nr:hypothetical protein [Clostridiales bacterium]